MTIAAKKLETLLFLLFVFLIPTQLALHFWPSWAFVYGFRIDYLAPTIYLTDALLLALLTLWTYRDSKNILLLIKKYKIPIILVILFATLNTTSSTAVFPTLHKWMKVLEFSAFAFYVFQNKKIVGEQIIFKTLFVSAVIFSMIGIVQFLLGRTIGGPLYFLGERAFTSSTPGIALVSLLGQNFLRAYSTFPHPNSLAGFLGVVLILVFIPTLQKGNWKARLGCLLIVSCFVLTFSLSAVLGLVAVFFLSLLLHKTSVFKRLTLLFLALSVFFSLLLPVFSQAFLSLGNAFSQSITERLNLAFISGSMISQKFWIGEGLNTFIVNIPGIKTAYSYSWLLQPVHNIFLLAFAETGILGLLAIVGFFYRTIINSIKTNPKFVLVFIFIAVTGMFDHYWFTIQQNLLLVTLIVGLL